MSLSKNNYTVLIDYIKNELKDNQWDEILCQIVFNGRVCSDSVRYYLDQQEFVFVTDVFETGPILHSIFGDYLQGKKERHFNEVLIRIVKDDFSVEYRVNEERIKKSKQESALIFSNYLYERMRSQILEYEINNSLLTPIFNDRFEVYDYKVSWDSGLFTFIVDEKTKKIYHEIELYFEGEKRIVPLELEEYYKESIWYHYELTHGELKEFWEPWNKMVVTAPKNFIPLGRDKEYIKYSLVAIDKEEIVVSTLLKNSLQFKTKDGSVLKYSQMHEIWGLRNYPVKLTWKYREQEITIEDEGQCFFFEIYNDKVIVLYHSRWSKTKKHPHNLFIYHADGSIMHKIEAPKFKSKKMIEGVKSEYDQGNLNDSTIWMVPPHSKEIKNIWGKVKSIEVMQGFMDVLRKENGEIIVTVSDSKYFEEQYLDVEKGCFNDKAKYVGRY